jgi:multidrug efflux pump subunit AcrA (membrane-fusion protein)
MQTGNDVSIELTAFPDQALMGKVILINPAQKIIDGVVYYETTIAFQNPPQNLRPGMTADVSIKTAERNNVLVVLGSAILEKDGKKIVQILKDEKNIEERQIEVGLKSDENMVEVVSGLQLGEKIIVQQ